MKTIDTLVDDIYSLVEYGKEPTPEFVEQFGQAVAKNVSHAMQQYMEDREGNLRMSNVGRPCTRQLYYEAIGADGEEIDAPTKLKFMFGHIIEEMLLYLAKEAGHSVSDEQAEVEIDGLKGHIDAVIDGYVVDVKSASFYAFKKFNEGKLAGDDAFGYIPQISGYAQALGKPAAFLAMDKSSGHICTLKIEEDEQPDMKELIGYVREDVSGDKPPPRKFHPVEDGRSGNMKLAMNCHYCAFKKTCYPGLRSFKYSNGIRHLTHVANLPKVEEVTDG